MKEAESRLASLDLKRVSKNRDRIVELSRSLTTIYTDVDGTLLGPTGSLFLDSSHQLTTRPAESIIAVLARDVDVVMVSGRHQAQLLETARLLGFQNYIAEMGTLLVYDRGARSVLNLGCFDPGELPPYEAMKLSGVLDWLLDAYSGRLEHHLPWSQIRDCTAILRGYIDTKQVNSEMASAGFSEFYIVDNGKIRRRSPALTVDEVHAYHVVPKGVSKEQGVALDRQLRDIPKENAIAIGDSSADLAFASEVAAFFMLANGILANPELIDLILNTDNVFITDAQMNLGWSEVVGSLAK